MNKRKEISHNLKHAKESSASSFLALLVSADLGFIVLHILWDTTSLLNTSLFSLSKDNGYPENYQYIKIFWIVILILSIFVKTREIGYFSWAMLFTYLLFDDAMRIHEQVGSMIASNMNFTPFLGLRLQDFGELIVTAISMVLLLGLVCFFYLRGSLMFKKITRDLLRLLLVLAFFGIFVDMLHIAVQLGETVSFLLEILEDGGEMIAISLVVWYVFLLNVRKEYASFPLCNLVRATLIRRSA